VPSTHAVLVALVVPFLPYLVLGCAQVHRQESAV
jgi:hypothetical protein